MAKTRTGWLVAVFGAACLLACADAYSFLSQPQEVEVLEGESAVIRCEVANLGDTQVVFWQNGSSVMAMARNVFNTDEGRITIGGTGNVYDLVINPVKLSDEGSYTCQIPGSDGAIQQKNMLTVNIPPTVELTPDMDELDMEIGEGFTLQCTATGKPEPDIVWTLPSDNDMGGLEEDDMMAGEVGGRLVLNNIQKEDAGVYTCTASNGAGSPVSRTIRVRVSYPPTVHVEKSTIYTGPGHKVSVECIFDANPPVSVIWTHNGTDVDFDQRQNIHMAQLSADNDGIREILEINNLQPTDLGTYRCDGGNDRGTAYEDVTLSALPHSLAIVSKRAGKYSDEYTLKWHAVSVPPIIEFSFMMKEVNNSGPSKWKNSTIPSSKAQYTLPLYEEEKVLKNLEQNTTYVVRLSARNAFGQTEWTERFRFTTSDEVAPPPDAVKKVTQPNAGGSASAATQFASTSIAALVLTALSLLMLA